MIFHIDNIVPDKEFMNQVYFKNFRDINTHRNTQSSLPVVLQCFQGACRSSFLLRAYPPSFIRWGFDISFGISAEYSRKIF
jgi:hypothetical protein